MTRYHQTCPVTAAISTHIIHRSQLVLLKRKRTPTPVRSGINERRDHLNGRHRLVGTHIYIGACMRGPADTTCGHVMGREANETQQSTAGSTATVDPIQATSSTIVQNNANCQCQKMWSIWAAAALTQLSPKLCYSSPLPH